MTPSGAWVTALIAKKTEGFSGADYWPEGMTAQDFYQPTGRGFEAKVAERIAYWNELRAARAKDSEQSE